jgi:elongation factor G
MDYMDLERERGITISSAATSVDWNDHCINLIDTPGHVDFTVEVERSLRVLDGAILVLCAVAGVQSQSMTVDRQMKRYHVPRLALINKMDRNGADYRRVVRQLHEKLHCDPLLMQLPLGSEQQFEGVVDLVTRQGVYFDGSHGQIVRRQTPPSEMTAEVAAARQTMLETLAMYSDELMELLLAEEDVPEELIHRVTKSAVQQQELTPVLLGAAYRNKGVQPLLDAIVRYLPSPADRTVAATAYDDPSRPVRLQPDPAKPMVGMAFKIVDDPYGQLTFLRIYQGTIHKGRMYFNQRTGQKHRFSRIVRMHADEREEADWASAGDIVAVMGVDCASGDTYAATPNYCTLESMFVPDPVIKMAIHSTRRDGAARLAKALERFRKEDPTFCVVTDPETHQILIAGMGELHLDIYVERIRREYKVEVEVGAPKVSYREAPTTGAAFNYRHKKQTGGAGQYAHVVGRLELLPEEATESFHFEDRVTGGRIPRQYITSVEKGFRDALAKGPVAGFPIVGVWAVLLDGSHHEVDSSDLAFRTCARNCFRETFQAMKPALLEPLMKLEVEVPTQYQGSVTGELNSRRARVLGTQIIGSMATIEAEVPLAETFGYSTALRSITEGQGTFTDEKL